MYSSVHDAPFAVIILPNSPTRLPHLLNTGSDPPGQQP